MCLGDRVPGCPQLAFASSPPLVGPGDSVLSTTLSPCLSSPYPMIPGHPLASLLSSSAVTINPSSPPPTHTPYRCSLSVNFHRRSMLRALTGSVIRTSSHCHSSPTQHFIPALQLSLFIQEDKTTLTVFCPQRHILNI